MTFANLKMILAKDFHIIQVTSRLSKVGNNADSLVYDVLDAEVGLRKSVVKVGKIVKIRVSGRVNIISFLALLDSLLIVEVEDQVLLISVFRQLMSRQCQGRNN